MVKTLASHAGIRGSTPLGTTNKSPPHGGYFSCRRQKPQTRLARCPYDNSCMESFFASQKKEYFYRREYATIDDVRRDLFYYIEIFYNRRRREEQ